MNKIPRFALAFLCCLDSVATYADLPTQGILPGHIWHSFSDLGNPQGTFVLDPNSGVSISVQSEKWGVPWPNANHFISHDYISHGSNSGETVLVVRRTSNGQIISEQTLDGDFAAISPAPQSSRILVAWGENTYSAKSAVVYDLAKQKLLYATPASKTPDVFSWMPDETLLRAKPSGEISRVVIGGEERPISTVKWPESRVPQAISVSPDGTKVLIQLAAIRETGSISGVELWMMNIDGSNLKRFTKNDLIANAFWSPDSRYVAFTKETGIVCTAATCRGSCTVWYAPATASNVLAVEESKDAKQFPIKRPDGSATNLRCPILAWTR